MPIDVTLSPTALRALEAVDEAVRILRDTRGRLGDLAARVEHVAIDADWQAPSAAAFHERLDRWRASLVTAQARTDEVCDALGRARAEIHARAWAELR
ncbi:hypothetical protein ACFXP7_05250 [Microbacterium sp. P06]|uniref:hypothetical protein n=1 Tax=unclassified Microbacterium TaxID=2609290 RepID=UPI0037467110